MKTSTQTYRPPRLGAAQIRLLERLSNACAVSGDEGEVRKIILEEVRPRADEVKVDALGNVLAIRRARQAGEAALKVMVDAHTDEVGFIVLPLNICIERANHRAF
jgi:endoglucanase